MVQFGRRQGDELTYSRGSGDTDTELEKLQSWAEYIHPHFLEVEADVRALRTWRDSTIGMLKVIATLQVLIIGLIIAAFTWGLNHMTFHSDYEPRPEHSAVQSPQTSDSR